MNDEQLIDYVCGELDDDARTQAEHDLANDLAQARNAERLRGVVEIIKESGVPAVSGDFSRRLHKQLAFETAAAPMGWLPRWWRWAPLVAAAVIIAVLLSWLPTGGGGGGSVAWADVVQAMNKVEHFHITAVIDAPQRADESERLFKIEMYYCAPDVWRAQGMHFVQFNHGNDVRMFDAEKRHFVDTKTDQRRLIPPDVVEQVRDHSLLDAILFMVFQGQLPPQQPARSTDAAASEGVEVFDYAHDATQHWARVWVLKASHLPLQIKIFEPRSNEVDLVSFDYSDPQPASYFDPDHFEKLGKELNLTDPRRIMEMGAEPIDGMPVNRGQVHDMLGDYKAAKVTGVAGNGDGAIMIQHTEPGNVEPRGGGLREEAYETPRDNWGNLYMFTGGNRPADGDWRRFYVPVRPFKHGQGQRIVTASYTIELRAPTGDKGLGSHDFIYRTLSTEHLPIDLGSGDKVSAQEQSECWSPVMFEKAEDNYLQIAGSATAQWARASERWRRDPHDMETAAWMYRLLRDHGRGVQAKQFIYDQVLPTFLKDPMKYAYSNVVGVISEYLQHQCEQQGIESLEPEIIPALLKARDEARQSKTRELPSKLDLLFDRPDYNYLGWVLKLPASRAAFEKAPKPTVIEAVRGKDGLVAVVFALPKDPMNSGEQSAINVWRPQQGLLTGWNVLTSRYDDQREHWSLLLQSNTSGDSNLVVPFTPIIQGRSNRGGFDPEIGMKWSLRVNVPAEPIADSAVEWWSKHVTNVDWRHLKNEVFNDIARQAGEAMGQGDYDRAIGLYQKQLAVPREQWPTAYNTGTDKERLYDWMVAYLRLKIIEAKIHTGNMEEPLKELAAMEAALPPLDLTAKEFGAEFRDLVEQQARLRAVRLVAVKVLMDKGRLTDAAKMLDEIEKSRSNPIDVPYRYVVVSYPNGSGSTYITRDLIARAWQPFDTLRWNLLDKMGSQPRQ